MGYDLPHRGTLHAHAPTPAAQAEAEAAGSDVGVAVSPPAMPPPAGPGTIVTAMTDTAHAAPAGYAVTIAAFAAVCLATAVCFLGGDRMVRHLSPSLFNVTGRLMGLILAVIGVQMLIGGIGASFGG